jgi:hypothetical protein
VCEAAGVHVRVLYAWVSRRTRGCCTRGCRGVRVGVEDTHVSVVGGVRTRIRGVEIRLSAEIK